MTGSNKTGCSVLWLCWSQQENAPSQLAFPQTEGGRPVGEQSPLPPSHVPWISILRSTLAKHRASSPLYHLWWMGQRKTCGTSSAPCSRFLALHTGRTWQGAFLQTVPRLKHPSYVIWSPNQKGRNNPAQALSCLTALFLVSTPQKAHRPGG